MSVFDTRATLLMRIRDLRDRSSWSEFVALYMPLIYAYSLKAGLQDADAADIAQEAMCDVIRSIQRFEYDRSKGSFRGWLFAITRNRLLKSLAKSGRPAVVGTGDTAVLRQLEQHSDDIADRDWAQELQLRLFHWAAERVKHEFTPKTWELFWETTVCGASIESTASRLNMSLGAAYIARSRVLARIRAKAAELED
ncbi:MAG: sigma-70 family RNA polymerase sigma factor [Pirellulales bacterium]